MNIKRNFSISFFKRTSVKKFLFFFTCFCLTTISACGDNEDSGDGDDGGGTTPPIEIPTPPAFPGAEGFARETTTGGRGGSVYRVTNLNDSGTGSLRYGINNASRPCIIVFDVSGTINLNSHLQITAGDLTIAGQTAPGDGICLKNYSLKVRANNVIVRFIRSRLGDEKGIEADAMEGQEYSNIIIDHCTMSWSTDECGSFYDNKNFTMQWCILSESLTNSVHHKDAHGYGGIWGGQGASFHHNLIAHHSSRTPRLCGSRYTNLPDEELVDLRNNVFYNWGPTNGAYAGEGGNYNFINNYYKPGPSTATKDQLTYRIFSPNPSSGYGSSNVTQPNGVTGLFYLNGNYFDGSCAKITEKQRSMIDMVNNDNAYGLHPDGKSSTSTDRSLYLATGEFTVKPVTTHTAQQAYEKVLAYAGASFKRDVIDDRIIKEVKAGNYTYEGSNGSTNGLIDSQDDCGDEANLVYNSIEKPRDLNLDGIADDWAAKYMPEDKTYKDIDPETGYSYLELYINSLVDKIMKEGCEGVTDSPCKNDFGLKGTE